MDGCVRDVAVGFEPSIAVNPEDPSHLVVAAVGDGGSGSPVHQFGYGWVFSHVSRDGGITWTSRPLPADVGQDPRAVSGTRVILDPVVRFLRDGSLLFVGLATHDTKVRHPQVAGTGAQVVAVEGVRVLVARSLDGGLTFPEVRVVAEENGPYLLMACGRTAPKSGCTGAYGVFGAPDKPWIDEGPDGTLLLTWRKDTFAPAASGPAVPCSVDPDLSWPPSCATITLQSAVSRDGGRTWSAPRMVSPTPCGDASPLVGADGVYRVSCWGRAPDGRSWVFLATSGDGGATWRRTPVAEARPTESANHLHEVRWADRPHLALSFVAPDGAPTLIASSDGGATWPNRITLDSASDVGPRRLAADATADAVYVSFYSRNETGLQYRAVRVDDRGPSAPLVLDPAAGESAEAFWDYTTITGTRDGAAAAWMAEVDGETHVRVARIMERHAGSSDP